MSKIGAWLTRSVNWLVTVFGKAGAWAILVVTLFTTWDVFSRFALGHGTDWATEYTGYFMVLIIFFGLAFTERAGDHIVVDFVTSRLSKKTQRRIAFLGKIIFLVYSVMLGYYGWQETQTSISYHSTSRTAANVLLWPFQLLIPVGLAITSLILVVEIFDYFKKKPKVQEKPSDDDVLRRT